MPRTIHDVHATVSAETRTVGALRYPDGLDAAFALGYLAALDFVSDVIAHRDDAVSLDELTATFSPLPVAPEYRSPVTQ